MKKTRKGPPSKPELNLMFDDWKIRTIVEFNEMFNPHGVGMRDDYQIYFLDPSKDYPIYDGDTKYEESIESILFPDILEKKTAKELKAYLDTYVISQEKPKKMLSTKLIEHFYMVTAEEEDLDVDMEKNNIILVGSTGVGKTYIIDKITKELGLPFTKVDATSYTAAGYVGGDIDDIIRRNLLNSANGDPYLTEKGVVYIDEIDKICAARGGSGPDVGGDKVQAGLLKLIEGKEVSVIDPHDRAGMEEQTKREAAGEDVKKVIDTTEILFIVGGAFSRGSSDKLVDIIKKRQEKEGTKKSSAFGMEIKDKNIVNNEDYHYLKDVKPEDFVSFGMGHEWIGRFPVIVPLENLNEDDLLKIMKKDSDDSLIKQYKKKFDWLDITLDFTEDALKSISSKAIKMKTGARGLKNIMENTLFEYQYELEGMDMQYLKVTKAMIENPEKSLKKLLKTLELAKRK